MTHNDYDEEAADGGVEAGSVGGIFTILDSSDGTVFFTEDSVFTSIADSGGNVTAAQARPYSPVAVAIDPKRGNFRGGNGNGEDVAIWSHSTDGGEL